MQTKKNGILKITILAISLMISSASAIAVALPMIKENFPDVSAATVESLVTVPSFTMLVFILLSSFIIKGIGKKNTVILGLSLAFLGGVIPAFATNFTLIYLSRFLLGAGTGIYNSLAVSLISDYFSGPEQQKMLGYQTAFSTLGSSFATFLAGVFVNLNWHYTFLIYFLTLPIVLLVVLFLPKDKKTVVETHESVVKEKQQVNLLVIFSCIMMFFFFVLIMVIYTKTATLVVEQNYANQAYLGTALTIASLVGALTGFVYSYIRNFLKAFTPVAALGLVGVAYLLIPIANNMMFLTVILIFTFLVVGLFVPYMYDVLLPGAPKNSVNLAVSLAMVACNLGSFFSPYIVTFLGSVFGNVGTVFAFQICAFAFFIMAVVFLIVALRNPKKNLVTSSKQC